MGIVEIIKPKIWEPVDFTIYFSFVKWTVLVMVVVEILARYGIDKTGTGFLFDQKETIMWVVRLIGFSFLGFRALNSFGHNVAVAAIAGGCSGFIVGLVIALVRFFDGVKLWKFFNVITEVAMVTVVGALVAILIVYLFNKHN